MSKFSMVQVNWLLEDWAKQDANIQHFTVEHIQLALSVPNKDYEKLFKFLSSKVGNELELKVMVLCPAGHKNETFNFGEDVSEHFFECAHCDEEGYEPVLVPVFSFDAEFKKDVKEPRTENKKKKYKLPRISRMLAGF